MSIFDSVLAPLEWVVAWLMVNFHTIFAFIGLPKDSGFTWALSIVGLVIVIRIVLIPLFVKQIHASRRMQLIQPEMQKIQKKYKGKTDPESRQAMTQETMGLYKRTGTNPFSSCLPILLQSPVFFALFRMLQALPKIANDKQSPIGLMTKELARSAEQSTVFGAPLSSYFVGAGESPLPLNTKIVTVVLIILMSVTTFTTQRQLMMKNMPANAMDNPFAKQQKVLLYLMPLFFAFSGINFPIGVLLYWLTTNLWSMGQQFYTIRRMPAPGSPAEKALEERRIKSGKEHKKFSIPGLTHDEPEPVQDDPVADTRPKSGQRQQPKRKNRAKPTTQPDGSAVPTSPPATSNGNATGAKPATGGNGNTKGTKPAKDGNGNPQDAKPAGAANGSPQDAKPAGAANGSPQDAKPARAANGISPEPKSPGRRERNARRAKRPVPSAGNASAAKPPAGAEPNGNAVTPQSTADAGSNGSTSNAGINGVKPQATSNAGINGVQPQAIPDGGGTNGVKPVADGNGSSSEIEPPLNTNGNTKGKTQPTKTNSPTPGRVKPPVTEH